MISVYKIGATATVRTHAVMNYRPEAKGPNIRKIVAGRGIIFREPPVKFTRCVIGSRREFFKNAPFEFMPQSIQYGFLWYRREES